jgi:hypothetical protein
VVFILIREDEIIIKKEIQMEKYRCRENNGELHLLMEGRGRKGYI